MNKKLKRAIAKMQIPGFCVAYNLMGRNMYRSKGGFSSSLELAEIFDTSELANEEIKNLRKMEHPNWLFVTNKFGEPI